MIVRPRAALWASGIWLLSGRVAVSGEARFFEALGFSTFFREKTALFYHTSTNKCRGRNGDLLPGALEALAE